jgi:hypothetical protein
MKRLTLLLLGLALGVATTAKAQGLTMQMSNGWTFSFSGNVNAFWVFSADSTKAGKNSSIRTGLLPAFATFEAKGKEAGMNLGIHFGFAPQIQNAGVHDQFVPTSVQAGASIDMRQVYMTIGFTDGSSLLVGRELGLFQRQNILTDMTLFGVGAVGGPQGGGTTLGRIGYGYIYPNFNAQVTYSTSPKNPAQLSIGLFQPSTFLGGSIYSVTKMPRLEAEVTYHQTSGANTFTVWAGAEWQSTSSRDAGDSTKSTIGGTAGVKANLQDLSIVVSGYTGSGLGTTFGFTADAVAANGTLRKSDGLIAQVSYAADKKTTLGVSWGTSRLKGSGTAETSGPIGVASLYTVGVYHQWTKSLKLVFEGSREINSMIGPETVLGGLTLNRTDISAGFMLFY